MRDRSLVAAATNLLARGFQVVPLDRRSRDGAPVNGLLAVARAVQKVLALRQPARAVAVVDAAASTRGWPPLLGAQLGPLRALLGALGLEVVETPDELDLVASYAHAAASAGDDVLVLGVDKRLAQLVTERVTWFDPHKGVRYTEEIVEKRFLVPPAQVAGWLALVGDEDQLPGVKGIGAKGASALLEAHGSVEAALAAVETIAGAAGKALRAAASEVPARLAQAHLDLGRPLPRPWAQLAWTAPAPATLNVLYERLGFSELLLTDAVEGATTRCETPEGLAAALAALGPGPIALQALLEDPDPVWQVLRGMALSAGRGASCHVEVGSPAWQPLVRWLEDPDAPKGGHDLVGALVALRRLGVRVAGLVQDSACQSHLTQPSGWAPHDLPLVARQALGRALPGDEELRGTGKARRAWTDLPPDLAAAVAGAQADASAAISRSLPVAPALLAEYLELSDTLARMELTGLRVDVEELRDAEASFAELERGLEGEIASLAGRPFNIGSSKQLGAVLFEELHLPVVSHTRTGWSTANEALERIEHAHPIVPLVIRWRGLRRLRDSWLVALRGCVDADGRVHSRFHPARSFSGHLINTHPDLGRVPGRTPEMARVRRAFVAPPGSLLMSVDFQQLGLRVLAHLSRDPALVEPLRQGADLHALTAAAVLELPVHALTHAQRQVGKVVNFATFAGQGAAALGMTLGLDPAEARSYLARFDVRYAGVRAFQDEQLRLAKERGYVETISGRRWPIDGLESLDPLLRSYAERLARRATHEGSVADISRRALLEADRALRRAGLATAPLVQLLDEVIFEVPEPELARAAAVCTAAMEGAFQLEPPLRVGVEVGPNWADLQPYPPASPATG
jgi:DNA polymerase-1